MAVPDHDISPQGHGVLNAEAERAGCPRTSACGE